MTPADRSDSADAAQDSRVTRTSADVSRVALQVLTSEGADAFSHAHVAEIAGYSKTTLYTHWPLRVDLIMLALDAIGDMPHQEPTGDLRADLIGELRVFRQVVLEYRLDQILAVMAQWASVEEMAQVGTESTPTVSDRSAACSPAPSTDRSWKRRYPCSPEWWPARR